MSGLAVNNCVTNLVDNFNKSFKICYSMDSATEELYFQKLQELVEDEDKIVTLASFASSMGISIQNSQKLIKKYVEDHRKLKSNDLAVTYVLTGLLKGTRGKGVFMVKEEDLKTKLSLFENEPIKLIYSVQKAKHVDFNIIALVDMFDSTNIREKALQGSIVSKNCTKRVLKIKKALPPPPPPTLKGKSSVSESKPSNSNEISKSAEKRPESSKSEQKSKASGSIANLFKAATAKSNQQNSKNGIESSSTSSKQTGKRKSGGLTGFLTNGAKKTAKNINSDEAKENLQAENKTSSNNESNRDQESSRNKNDRDDTKDDDEIMEIIDDDFEDRPVKEKTNKKEKVGKKANSDKNKVKQNKKRVRDKSEEMPSKRRKRIVERNDSDSDDMFEREDIIEKSDDEIERVPSPVREKPILPKNKRRKAVEKTYTDEEGFVVTKTEYIYETASEDENEAPAPPKQEKQPNKPEKPKAKVADKKKPAKNQSTLMNFFKKV